MSFVSHAQNFEDMLLWRALHDVPQGRYIDIGAQDPLIDSVSYAFYQRGWRGLHVEPSPHYAAMLREARPDEKVIEAAVTDAPGPIEFYEIVGTGLSTGNPAVADQHRASGYAERKITVPCVRLNDLLDDFADEIHWMKVDVEGMEADVLRSWGSSNRFPWILCIEATLPNSQTPSHQAWISEVLGRGYEEAIFDGLSRYYVHQSHADRLERLKVPANIFDNFTVPTNHFTARALNEQLEAAGAELRREQAASSALEANAVQLDALLSQQRHRTEDLDARLQEEAKLVASTKADLDKASGENDRLQQELARAHDEASKRVEEYEALLLAGLNEKRATESRLNGLVAKAESRIADLRADADRMKTEIAQGNLRNLECRHHLNAQLERAREGSRLVAAAIEDKPSLGYRIRQVFAPRIHPAWRALQEWAAGSSDRPDTRITDQVRPNMNRPHPSGTNPYLRADSLAELLAWNDIDFVRCAYVTMLGRQPDVVGENYYLERVRTGHSKVELLWQLRRSTEGRNHDPGIAGLDRVLKRAAWERKPVVGAVVRLFTGGASDDRLSRLQRIMLNELGAIRGQLQQGTHPEAANDRFVAQKEMASPRSQQNPSPRAKLALDIMSGRTQ